MGVYLPLNRKQLIEQHISQMRTYAACLRSRIWPFIRISEVTARIEKCADQIERRHRVLITREQTIDRGD